MGDNMVNNALNRKEELLKLLNNDIRYVPLINEMVYLEDQLDELRELPKIKVHPEDKTKQKTTPAAKLYKEYLQQYTNIVRILMKATGTDETEEESPLRKWLNEHI
jgi:hypothetical protein